MKLRAIVEIELMMKDGENFKEANNRLFDLLYGGLCCNADANCDFWIDGTKEID